MPGGKTEDMRICKDFASRILDNDAVVLEHEDMKRRLIKLENKMTKLLEIVSTSEGGGLLLS
jgi:hypothetical protein